MTLKDNKRRSLGRLAITRAWFDPIPDRSPPRYSFHMDVTFQQERLGGGPNDPVRFQVGLKRCELVVMLPRGEERLKIDPRTIAVGQTTTDVTIRRATSATSEVSAGAGLGVGASGATGSANFSAKAKRSRSVEATSEEILPVLLGTRSESTDGHQSWNIARMDGAEVLEGLLWNANKDEPRFELIDGRPPAVRDREERTGLHATVTIEVRCKRQDLEVTEVSLTDPEESKTFARLTNRRKATKVAEAFIKKKLQEEGLRVGDVHEQYSDMVIGDLIVSLVENDDF
ncbi:hypothetical protein [Palleronia sp.]|uniref:hypothetical protein n=1 Tax=Palleronia sp. TaxID=1940284 RepID=UPI0035C86CA6